MRDYLLRFPNEVAALAAFPRPEGNPPAWMAGSLTIVPVIVWLADPAADTTDEEGRTVRGRTASEGYWLGIASTEPMDERHPATIVEMERPDEPTGWRECIRWAALAEMPPVVAVEPTFAGSGYQFE